MSIARGYAQFLRANRRFVGFGFLMALASSFGQTYFIGVFGPALRDEFGLGNTAWGSVYMFGTIASAIVLPFTGKLIDRYSLRRYATAACVLLGVACLLMASAASAAWLVLAVFALRQSGQGLMSHTAVTAMARHFDTMRGRAIAIATLGFAVGEAILPIAAVTTITLFGWRGTYVAAAALAFFVLLPAVLVLLRGHEALEVAIGADTGGVAGREGDEPVRRSWTRAEVLRDWRFYVLLPGLLAPAFSITALFFHQLTLAEAKGWSAAWVTGNYIVYAGVTTGVSLLCGPAIDRIGAVRLVPWMLLPMAAALVLVAGVDGRYVVWGYLGLLGANVGISHTAVSALWAELYGTRHLGGVRSMTTAVSVFATALGPVTVGWLMDNGVEIERICLYLAAYALLGSIGMGVALRRRVVASIV